MVQQPSMYRYFCRNVNVQRPFVSIKPSLVSAQLTFKLLKRIPDADVFLQNLEILLLRSN